MQLKNADRTLSLAVAVAFSVLIASLILRPVWRDEYWALYFSAPDLPLRDAMEQRMVRDVHPPFYFILLHFWRAASQSELWARLFNLVALGAGGACVWLLGRKRGRETALFLVLCAGSYWAIFFGAEARMYALVFAACAVALYAARVALEAEAARERGVGFAAFVAAGAVAAGSHYFGGLWIASLGLCLGIAFLGRRRFGAFAIAGLSSVIALAPTAAWILHASPETKPGAEGDILPLGEAFGYAANQFLRGLVVKTFGSNLPAFAAAFLAVPALARRRDAFDAVALGAVVLTVVIAFAVHLFALPLIKERAFIVIMPAVIFLCVRGLQSLTPDQPRALRLAALVPAAALITPFLFTSEYFKDREQLVTVRKLIAQSGQCAGAPVLTYFRPSAQAQDFHPFMLGMALKGSAAGGGDVTLIDASKDRVPTWAPGCRLRAVALVLGKGETPMHAEARRVLKAAGAPLENWEERRLGKGRSLVWLAPAAAPSAALPAQPAH